MNEQNDDAIGTEGYYFEVGDTVNIHANTTTGVFYGTRSALQILQQDTAKSSIVKGIAKDYPKYKERGFMLDVGRKFLQWIFEGLCEVHVLVQNERFSNTFER